MLGHDLEVAVMLGTRCMNYENWCPCVEIADTLYIISFSLYFVCSLFANQYAVILSIYVIVWIISSIQYVCSRLASWLCCSTELVTKPYCHNRDWHVCTTVNLCGFKTAVLWLHVQVILNHQFPGISVLGFFVDMVLNTVHYHLMFCLKEWDSTLGVKGVGKSGLLVHGGCQKMWINT
jgi:hypothetical protein